MRGDDRRQQRSSRAARSDVNQPSPVAARQRSAQAPQRRMDNLFSNNRLSRMTEEQMIRLAIEESKRMDEEQKLNS